MQKLYVPERNECARMIQLMQLKSRDFYPKNVIKTLLREAANVPFICEITRT